MGTDSLSWPRFRGNRRQDGRVDVGSRDAGLAWQLAPTPASPTPGAAARGIFNSAVIDAQGQVWSGNAHAELWRVSPQGERAIQQAGGLIDTTPLLLGDKLYVSCGDGWIWRQTVPKGLLRRWFESAQPAGAFINWFEGQLGTDGQDRIVAPCDNKRLYLIDPHSRPDGAGGELPPRYWDFPMLDQGWSLACCNKQGWLFFGNNAMRPRGLPGDVPCPNLYGVGRDLNTYWTFETLGSVVASPLWHQSEDGKQKWLYVGSFDGTLYAFDFSGCDFAEPNPQGLPGAPAWTFTTRDHLYASPAQLSDGTLIQAGVDGSLYALDPYTGALRWQYDEPCLNPFRSSPAVASFPPGHDLIYLGSGDGHLLMLSGTSAVVDQPLLVPDAHGPRKAVNASPAIGPHGVVIGDSEGWLHQLPWPAPPPWASPAMDDSQDQPWPDGLSARLRYTTAWGVNQITEAGRARAMAPAQPLCFTLEARLKVPGQPARPVTALLDTVALAPALREQWELSCSGDRRYVIVQPKQALPAGATVSLALNVTWRTDPQRQGLRMRGGHRAGSFSNTFAFQVQGSGCPLEPPATLWFQRMTVSLPTLMPSYNQIGFETLVYALGRVHAMGDGRYLYWLMACKESGAPDPATHQRFALVGTYAPTSGSLRLEGTRVVSELNGFRTALELFSLTCLLDGRSHPRAEPSPVLRMRYLPSDIEFYGDFLEGLGMGGPGQPIESFGSGDLLAAAGPPAPPVSEVQAVVTAQEVRLSFRYANRLKTERSCLSVLLFNTQRNEPVHTDYTYALRQELKDDMTGHLTLTRTDPARDGWPTADQAKVWLMVNTTAMAATVRPD